VVLVAVADDEVVGRVAEGQHGLELGLGAALQPDAVRPPVLEDLLDHVALLVDLDRVHGGVAARVLELGRGGAEALGQLLDARPEDVAEAQQHGERDALLLEVAGELEQRELASGWLRSGRTTTWPRASMSK
jgi:hypothetical protein